MAKPVTIQRHKLPAKREAGKRKKIVIISTQLNKRFKRLKLNTKKLSSRRSQPLRRKKSEIKRQRCSPESKKN
jgi:hypothetical protein